MRSVSVIRLLAVFLVSGWGIVPSRGHANETETELRQMIALDLMDLEIPGEGSGSEMDLPPIQGEEKNEVAPEPPAPPEEPEEVEQSRPETPERRRSAESPEPGLAPFLLEDPAGVAGGSTRTGMETTGEREPETLPGEFPVELKTIPPPPSHGESLKLSSEMDASAPSETDVPEIPLLKSEDVGQRVPVGRDSSLTMKPLPDLHGTPHASRESGHSPESRGPEDYLQVREEMDSKLMNIYERHYKDR